MNAMNNIPQQKSFNVLLIGDTCLDVYKFTKTERLNPESPAPLLSIVETKEFGGMALNVMQNLSNMGVYVDAILSKNKIIKTRYVDKKSGYMHFRVDSDVVYEPFTDFQNIDYDDYDAVIVVDYEKGFVTDSLLEHLDSVSVPVFVDTKKKILDYQNIIFKINESEYKSLIIRPKNCIVTLGASGCMYNGKTYPTEATEVFDVCGAGDSFLAGLAREYLHTKSIEKGILFALKTASVAIKHIGVYAPTLEEIYAS
jgi:D-glycero-beta-D-manno-heptose-7-phosphate kinase